MKKLILTFAACLTAAAGVTTMADNRTYVFLDEEENFAYGALRRVSPNGSWVTGGDESEETGSFLINTADPTNYIFDDNGLMLDVDDNGLAVGAYYEKVGSARYKRAAIYSDGQWIQLPLPEQIIGQSYAVAISADSKTIAGHGMCANDEPDEPGKYYPMVWTLDETTGSYQLTKLYNNLQLPGTMGFFIQDMTPDGKIVCGCQWLDMGDTIAAILNIETGEYTIWHTIEYKEYPWEFRGQTYWAVGMFVDGLLDGFDEYTRFGGRLNYATDRYIFGSRGTVHNVQPDGSGEIINTATVYDLVEGRFTDGATDCSYSCGLNPEDVFTTMGDIIDNGGKPEFITEFVGTEDNIDMVYGMDDSRRILAGSHIAYTPWGEPFESPVLIILEEPAFAGISDIRSDFTTVKVKTEGRTVHVEGAERVEIFTTSGALVSTSSCATLTAGVYIIVADGTSHKVVVK